MNSNKIMACINWFSAGLLLCTSALFFFSPVETGDIWWHLKIGEFIWGHHYVPNIDPFPFSKETTPWVLTQWMGSLFYFLVYKIKGLLGLKIARMLILTGIVGLFLRYAWKKIPQALAVIMGMLLILTLDSRPYLRPFVFNFIFIQIFLICLLRYPRTGTVRSLLPILICGILWVNTHLGSFMYGLTLVGVFVFSAFIQLLLGKGSNIPGNIPTNKQFWGYFLTFICFLAVFLFNPYGINGFLHPWKTLFVDNYIHFNSLRQTIGELQPPTDLSSWMFIWGLPTFIIGGLAVYQDRTHRFRNLILFIFTLFLFVSGRRASVFFVLTSLYIFVDSYASIDFNNQKNSRKLMSVVTLILGLMFVTVALKKQSQIYFKDGKVYRYRNLLEAPQSPREILGFVSRHKLSGRMFNDDIYGGYVLWNDYPRIRPFSDTRQINLRAHQMYMAVLHDPAKYWPEVDHHIRFKALLLDANKLASRRALLYFLGRKDWNLAMISADKVLFLRQENTGGVYLRLLRSEDANIKRYYNQLADILKAGPKHEHNYVYMEPVASAMTLFELGFRGAALERLLYSFKIANTPYQHNTARLLFSEFNR